MKSQEKIRVKITKTNKWYKKDEIHEVLNYVTFAFVGGDPCYEKSNGSYGIHCADCEILTIPELSMKDLFRIFGYEFNIKKDEQ